MGKEMGGEVGIGVSTSANPIWEDSREGSFCPISKF